MPMISRNDFSVWSILKQCIGKVRFDNSALSFKFSSHDIDSISFEETLTVSALRHLKSW